MTTAKKPKDDRTVESLIEAVEELKERVGRTAAQCDEYMADRDRWRDAKPLPDKEAAALAGAIVALDTMTVDNPVGYPTRYGDGRFDRVLRFLAHRYGVEWPEAPQSEDIYASVQEDIRAGEQILVRPDGAWRVR